jgi:hypothetical protein
MRGALIGSICLLACGDDSGVGADAGPADAAPVDAAPGDGAVAECAEGSGSAVIGEAGGELALCGARLAVPAGALTESIEFAIEVAEAPEPLPPRELAGLAFRFTADGAPEVPALVDLSLPHGGSAGRIELFRVEGADLIGIEPCTVDDDIIGQRVGFLGVFVATVDPYPYADSPGDLGSGSLSASIGERSLTFELPADGYAIDQAWDDPVVLSLVSDLVDGPGGSEQLRIDAVVDAGDASLAFAQWYSEGRIGQLGTPEAPGTNGEFDLESASGGRLIGTLSATLYAGEDTIQFSAEVDVIPEYWTFPPERFCTGKESG